MSSSSSPFLVCAPQPPPVLFAESRHKVPAPISPREDLTPVQSTGRRAIGSSSSNSNSRSRMRVKPWTSAWSQLPWVCASHWTSSNTRPSPGDAQRLQPCQLATMVHMESAMIMITTPAFLFRSCRVKSSPFCTTPYPIVLNDGSCTKEHEFQFLVTTKSPSN